MEAILTYLLKAGGVLALFLLTYQLFLKKETFFNLNRHFLLGGVLVSLILPFISLKRIIYIERPNFDLQQFAVSAGEVETSVPFNWQNVLVVIYVAGLLFLSVRLAIQLYSLRRLIQSGTLKKEGKYNMVITPKETAPFSFFNYIVYNPDMFDEESLQTIIAHEKTHVDQWHSFDIILMHLYSIISWMNPLVWVHKSIVAQNLEYIADNDTACQTVGTKQYQYLLLHTSIQTQQPALTNNFFNSLTKKRIVMLQKSKSNKRNIWKYSLILPLLTGFVFLFNVKTIAQVKQAQFIEKQETTIKIEVLVDKNTTDDQLKKDAALLKTEHAVELKFKGIKRNSKGEITAISSSFKSRDGKSGNYAISGDDPIKSFVFYKKETDGQTSYGYSQKSSQAPTAFSWTTEGDKDHKIFVINEDENISKNIKWIQAGDSTGVHTFSYRISDSLHSDEKENVFIMKAGSDDVMFAPKSGKHKMMFIKEDGNIIHMDSVNEGGMKQMHIKVIRSNDSTKWKDKKIGVIELKGDGDDAITIQSGSNDENVIIRSKSDAPVFIVNGKVVKGADAESLDPENIATIDVIKDRSATTVYGEDGKNGVIRITTKEVSFDSSGETPLFIVDGKEMNAEDAKKIAPENIKSIDVIKGKAAVEKYGDKGKDGVVNITTKQN